MKTNRKESQVKAAIHAYLDTRTDYFGWRSNSGGARYDDFFVKFNAPGVADFLGVQALQVMLPSGMVVGLKDSVSSKFFSFVGRFTAIEAKREKGGKQSDDQIRFQKNVEAHGGLYVLASSVDEVVRALGPVQVHIVKHRRERITPR